MGTKGKGNAVAGFVSMAAGALSAGAAIAQATNQGNTWTRTLSGMSAGAAAGTAIFPGLGTAIGAGAGALVGFVRGITQISPAIKDARKDVEAFQQTLASTLTAPQLQEAGGERWKMTIIAVRDALTSIGRAGEEAMPLVEALWDTDNPARARAAMEEIAAVMADYHTRLEENTKASNTLFTDIIAFAGANGGVPKAMQATIDKFVEMGILTEDQVKQLKGLGESGTLDIKKLDDALALFNGRASTLGPTFAQAKLDETARKYINAFELMGTASDDIGARLFDAKEEFSALAQEAIDNKLVLPAQMQPWMEELDRAGLLLDKDGNKIKGLGNLKYGAALKTEAEIAREGWEKIIGKIDELISRITGPAIAAVGGLADFMANKLPGAARTTADSVEDAFRNRMRPAIDDAADSLDRFNFGRSPGGLKEIPILLSKAAGAMSPFKAAFSDAMRAAERQLEVVLKKMGDFKEGISFGRISGPPAAALKEIELLEFELEGRKHLKDKETDATREQISVLRKSKDPEAELEIERLEKRLKALADDTEEDSIRARIDALKKTKDPFEGFAQRPELLNQTQALDRINAVFENYMGHRVTTNELEALAKKYGYGGKGQISKDRLDEFLKKVVDEYLEQKYQGFASGTEGADGKWFVDFGPKSTVNVHGREAIVPEHRVHEFVNDVGGGGGSTVVNIGETVLHLHVAVDPNTRKVRLIGPQEIRDLQTAIDTGQIRIPARVVTQRSR
jgi:hypothetical protein